VTTTSSARLTTSTAYTTVTRTVTDCPVYVECPEGGYVTTETIPIYTTICPVTETEDHPAQPTETEGVPGGCDGDCPDDEPTDGPGGCDGDCPGEHVTLTETEAETVTKPVDEPSVPTGGVPDVPGEDEDDVTSTTKVTTTVLTTITVSEDTETATTITKSYIPSSAIPTGGLTATADGSEPSHTAPVQAGSSGLFVGLTTLSVALAMHVFLL